MVWALPVLLLVNTGQTQDIYLRGPRPDYGQSDWASQAECDGGKVTEILPVIELNPLPLPSFHPNTNFTSISP